VSLDAMDWVWAKSKSKGVGRLVMLALADKAKPAAGECKAYGSLSFLQQRANCTREAVTDAITALGKLGELAPVEGEKGPYGAAVYRLPKAIGHVRPEANRSAHPTDSESAIGRLTRPGVVGSPDQSERESVGSPDHTTNLPPKTTTSAPSGPSASTASKGGGGGPQQEAEAFLQSLPEPWTAGRKTARDLAPLLVEAITEQGWQLNAALIKKLTENPGGIGNYASVLKKRIADLPKRPTTKTRDSPTQPARPLPPWCEDIDCDEETRLRHGTVNGFPYSGPCHCHPDHQEDTAA
jgi:hypothetical protein